MKRNFWFTTILAVLFGAAVCGCDKTEQETPVITYSLHSDKTKVEVGETVVFTVKSSEGYDVTTDWIFYDADNVYSSCVVSYDAAGEYVVSARSQSDDSVVAQNTVTISVFEAEIPDAPVTYALHSDKTTAVVGELITFNVISSTGEDVTSEWSVCDESFCYVTNAFSYNAPGTHVVTAHCTSTPELEAENTVTVTITASDEDPSVDPETTYIL